MLLGYSFNDGALPLELRSQVLMKIFTVIKNGAQRVCNAMLSGADFTC